MTTQCLCKCPAIEVRTVILIICTVSRTPSVPSVHEVSKGEAYSTADYGGHGVHCPLPQSATHPRDTNATPLASIVRLEKAEMHEHHRRALWDHAASVALHSTPWGCCRCMNRRSRRACCGVMITFMHRYKVWVWPRDREIITPQTGAGESQPAKFPSLSRLQ